MYNIDLGNGKMIYYSHFLTIKDYLIKTKELYELNNLTHWIRDSIADKSLTEEDVEKLRKIYLVKKAELQRLPIGASIDRVLVLKILKETDKAYFILGYNDIIECGHDKNIDYNLSIEEIKDKLKPYKKWVPKVMTEFYDKDFLTKRKIGID